MNLTGNWKGKYTLGNGYPLILQGTSSPFTISLLDEAGIITGTCIDPIVKAKAGNESVIQGTLPEQFTALRKKVQSSRLS